MSISALTLLADDNASRMHLLQRRHFLCTGVGLCALTSTSVWAQTTTPLKLTRIGHGPGVDRMESALRAVYFKLGMVVDFVEMPGERAIVESNSGRADGETARIVGVEAAYPNLRRLDVPLRMETNSVFVYGAGKSVPDSLSQLAQLQRVGIVRGWKVSEEATAGWAGVVRVPSYASALHMLKLGRLDAFLGRTEDTLRAFQHEGLNLADYPNMIVLRFPLFHYLHKKHEALFPGVTQELLRLKAGKDAVVEAGIH